MKVPAARTVSEIYDISNLSTLYNMVSVVLYSQIMSAKESSVTVPGGLTVMIPFSGRGFFKLNEN
jgi:hypothetical protein